MRVVGVSDLHFGMEGWDDEAVRIAREAAEVEADVLYFGGDLAEDEASFKRGLEILATSNAKVKLFVLGNNDLELLKSSQLGEHYSEFEEILESHGFHLLDSKPFIKDGIAFVGNAGWYDGSLWKYDPNLEQDGQVLTEEVVREGYEDWFLENFRSENMSSQEFFDHCKERLESHLDYAENNAEAIVLGIHYVPDPAFVRYDNPKFQLYNWAMGSELHAEHYQRDKVVLGLTAHTHRSESHIIGDQEIYNISGPGQPRVFDINKGNHGYEVKEVNN